MFKKTHTLKSCWWVIQTKTNSEILAIKQLNNQGFNTYCPMYRMESLRGRQVKIKKAPLFPRYVFIEANEHAKNKIHTIRSTYGVSLLLKIGEIPTKVSAEIIQKLREIESENINNTRSYFKTGEVVKITEGLYEGLEAIFDMDDGLERVVVLLNILNKDTSLRLYKNQVSKI